MSVKFIIILNTTPTLDEAKKIAKYLVENSLVACVNIIKNECSIYKWQDKICEDKEYQLIIKTKKSLFLKVKMTIESIHSYEVPEIISLDITDGNNRYLTWVNHQVSSPNSSV